MVGWLWAGGLSREEGWVVEERRGVDQALRREEGCGGGLRTYGCQWLSWTILKSFRVCLFGVYYPTREFFTHIETLPLPVNARAANFDLTSAPMAIER